MKKEKWQFTKINQGIEMARPNHQKGYIETRKPNWWEKLIYLLKKKLIKLT